MTTSHPVHDAVVAAVAEDADDRAALAERERLAVLAEYALHADLEDAELDAVTRLAAAVTGLPLAVVNIIDETDQVQVAACGLEPSTTPREDSMCARHFTSGQGLVHVPDASADPGYAANPWVTGRIAEVRQYASAPLVVEGGYALGTLCVGDLRPGTLTASQREALEDLARVTTGLLARRRQTRLAARLATTDPLTGLPNRRGWHEQLGRLLARAGRTGDPLVVALADVDHFKAFNDRHGHQAGDRALREVAARLTTSLRGGDLVARWGGEEIAVALPDCDTTFAGLVLDRARRAVPDGCTVSVGFARWDGAESPDELLGRADAALYAAKAAGRDRVVAWEPGHASRWRPGP
ncbi:GGDEF domain-containing protein [Thalassiella azotivora]